MRRNTIFSFLEENAFGYVGDDCKAMVEKIASEIMNRGMKCLTEQMGIINAEHFISVIIREKFDYTKWQREYFDAKTAEEISAEVSNFESTHPFISDAVRL